MASDVTVTSQMQMYADVSAINNAISGINNFIQKLEQLESTANRVFSVFNNMSTIHFPTLSDIPPMPQPPQPPQPPDPPMPPQPPDPPLPPQPPDPPLPPQPPDPPMPPQPPDPPMPPQPPDPPKLNWNPKEYIEIFNTSGVERYKSEISALDTQMRQLTSNRVDSIISNNMAGDINAVNKKIWELSQSIQSIQNKGLGNMGADRANNQIEQLRKQLNAALRSQTNLNNAIKDMNPSAAQREFDQLNQIINNANRHIRDNINSQNQFNNSIRNGENAANALLRKLRNIVGTYLTIRGVGQVINLSDKMTQATARLNMIVDKNGSVEELKSKVFDVAQSSRAGYIQTMDLVGKLGVQAGKAFTSNDELLAFTDQLNKHFAIAGTNAEGISGATLQLTQALGSGVLRGQELNSVFTQAPTIIQSIADYLGVDIGQIRKMAEEGLLTANVVKNGVFYTAEKINKKFDNTAKTFSQIWTNIKNNAVIAFDPILNKLSEIANSKDFQVLVQNIINGLSTIGTYLSYVFEFVCSIAGFFSENWTDIGPVIKSIAIDVGLLVAAYTAFKVIMGIVNFVSAIHSAHLALQAGATFSATAAQYGFNASLLACPITWIIAAVIAFIAVIVYFINKLGGLKACWELVKMSFQIGLINLQIVGNIVIASLIYAFDSLKIAMIWCKNQVLNAWDSMSLGISSACIAIQNFIGDMKANSLMILQNMINGAIGLINSFISKINSIGVVEFGLIETVTFGTEAAIANEAEKVARNTMMTLKEMQVNSDIAKRQNDLNQAIADREKNWNEAMAENSALEMERALTKLNGMVAYNAAKSENQYNDFERAKENAAGTYIPNVGDTPDLAGGKDKGKKGNNSVDRVGKVDKVGGTVDISSEELKRMRDIYENDIIQEVYVSNTTPQVNIQFGDVRETADVDEMLRIIKSKIRESLNISAEGVH